MRKFCLRCRPGICKHCTSPAAEGRDACLSCRPIDCQHCHGPLRGEIRYCPDCTPHGCDYCSNRPGAKGRNIVRGKVPYTPHDWICCEECKDYFCIKHTTRLSYPDRHKHVICKECKEKCFYCEHRTKDPYNKKLEGKESCQECLDYFCKSHNWLHAKETKLDSWHCPKCQKECWVCQGPIKKKDYWDSELICEKCAENYCPTHNPAEAKKVGNTFRCEKCTRLHGCRLTSHGRNNQKECTCDERRRKILRNDLEKDLIHPELEVLVTYDVEEEEHDGYCSDHYNNRMTEKIVTKRYPLPINFTSETVDRSFYERVSEGHGNGYCGLETRYKLTDLKVIKKAEGYTGEVIKKKKHRNRERSLFSNGWITDEEFRVRPPVYRYISSSDSSESTSTEED